MTARGQARAGRRRKSLRHVAGKGAVGAGTGETVEGDIERGDLAAGKGLAEVDHRFNGLNSAILAVVCQGGIEGDALEQSTQLTLLFLSPFGFLALGCARAQQ